ncbi:sensor histidine kinase [Mariniluteicoccus endophyticus]
MTATNETAAAGRAATTARSARRFETYVRWTLYSFVLLEAAYLLMIVIDGAYNLSVFSWSGAASGLAHVVLDILVCRWAFGRMRTPGPWPKALLGSWLATGLITIAGFMPWLSPRSPWPIVIPAVTMISLCMVLPLMDWRGATTAAAAMVAVVGGCALPMGMDPAYRLRYFVAGAAMVSAMLLSAYSFVWMLGVLHRLQDAQEDQARLAVADERLRISRDLHDVFGRTLATIAVKSELASELVRRERNDDAARELTEIRAIAASAGKEVRHVVRGDIVSGLGQELDGARSLLTSAGIATTVVGEEAAVPADAAQVLAWIVREGVTNVLRHSSATQASVSVAVDDEATTLMLANDGATLTGTSGSQTGIASMRDRLAPLGGTLDVTHDGGWFTLVATVPTRTKPRDPANPGDPPNPIDRKARP